MSPPCGIKVWFGHKIHEYRTRKNVTLTHWSGASITRFAMILSWIILIFPRSHGLKKKEKFYCHRKQKLCDDCVDLFSLLLWHQSWGFFSRCSGRCYCWSCINIISPSMLMIIFACSPEHDITRRFLACLEHNKGPNFHFFDRYIYWRYTFRH